MQGSRHYEDVQPSPLCWNINMWTCQWLQTLICPLGHILCAGRMVLSIYLLLMTVTEIRSCEITPYILLLKAITSSIDLQSRCTLASMMLTLYLIPCKRDEPWQFFLAALEEQLPVGYEMFMQKTFLSTKM